MSILRTCTAFDALTTTPFAVGRLFAAAFRRVPRNPPSDVGPLDSHRLYGDGGIRTPDTVARILDFESSAFSRTRPRLQRNRRRLSSGGVAGQAPFGAGRRFTGRSTMKDARPMLTAIGRPSRDERRPSPGQRGLGLRRPAGRCSPHAQRSGRFRHPLGSHPPGWSASGGPGLPGGQPPLASCAPPAARPHRGPSVRCSGFGVR